MRVVAIGEVLALLARAQRHHVALRHAAQQIPELTLLHLLAAFLLVLTLSLHLAIPAAKPQLLVQLLDVDHRVRGAVHLMLVLGAVLCRHTENGVRGVGEDIEEIGRAHV